MSPPPSPSDPDLSGGRPGEYALGRLQGQVDSLHGRVGQIETAVLSMNGKLDAIANTLAAQAGGRVIWRWLANALVASAGWAMFALATFGVPHK